MNSKNIPIPFTTAAFAICLMALAQPSMAGTFGLFSYDVYGDTVTITDYPDTAVGNVVIPAIIEDKPVTNIEGHAFGSCSGLTGITIPNSVTHIGDASFMGCSSLTSITIPDSVTGVGFWTFQDCTKLASVKISKNMTTISGSMFSGCTSLASVTIPSGVTIIGGQAFFNCTGLTSVTIPNSVITIEYDAFRSCSHLASVTIPNSVTTIEFGAFNACTRLAGLTMGSGVTTIGYLFDGTGSWSGAFAGCTSLTSVTLPNKLTTLGVYTFAGCTSLANVTIGSGLTTIGNSAFSDCTSLKRVTIPNSVTTIEYRAFKSCSSMTSVMIGSGVTMLMYEAFMNCSSLTKAVFLGNAPSPMGWSVFDTAADGFTIHYLPTSTGFTSPTWNGYPCVAVAVAPEIVVEQPAGSNLVDGTAKKSFGTVKIGKTGFVKTFTIRNIGTASLTRLAITKNGTNAMDFSVTAPAKNWLAPGTSTSFKVNFKPTAVGTRNAAIHIRNNDTNENPFDIKLTGQGVPP